MLPHQSILGSLMELLKSNALLLDHQLDSDFLTFRNVWNPLFSNSFKPFLHYGCTLDHTQLISLHSVSLKELFLSSQGGSFCAGLNLKWHRGNAKVKRRQKNLLMLVRAIRLGAKLG